MCRFLFVGYSSGQRGQTVNLLANAFSGSNPLPTTNQLAFGEFFFVFGVMRPWDFRNQLLDNYLKLTGCKLGLLVNFGFYPKVTIKRWAN